MFQYVDKSVTPKACAGLNGMKLGGQVLTVVQAIPDASPSMVHCHLSFLLFIYFSEKLGDNSFSL